MTNLSEFTDMQLRLELEKREKAIKEPPKMIKNPDFTDIIVQAAAIVQLIVDGHYHEDYDHPNYIYEAVMEAVYGEDIWTWYNNNVK